MREIDVAGDSADDDAFTDKGGGADSDAESSADPEPIDTKLEGVCANSDACNTDAVGISEGQRLFVVDLVTEGKHAGGKATRPCGECN